MITKNPNYFLLQKTSTKILIENNWKNPQQKTIVKKTLTKNNGKKPNQNPFVKNPQQKFYQ